MPPFQPKQTVPVPAPTLPSATGPSRRAADGREHVVARHVAAADVVQAQPSLVSPTTALTERTSSLPCRPSV